MKRTYTAIALILLLPILAVIILYFVNQKLQPDKLIIDGNSESYSTAYFNYDHFHEISGTISTIPGKCLSPEAFSSEDSIVYISSLRQIRNEIYRVGDYYMATIHLPMKLPSAITYALWLPSEFTDMRVFSNGSLLYETPSFAVGTPTYPAEAMVSIPQSEDGFYDIVINVKSPINYVNSASPAIFFGTEEEIGRCTNHVYLTGIAMSTFVIFTILFAFVQLFALKTDKRLSAFIILSVMTLLVMSFSDGRPITRFIPILPYQIGCFLEALSTPFFLLSLLYYTYTMYPDLFSRKAAYIFSGLLLVPLVNALCLAKFPALAIASTMISVIPYAMCLYAFVAAFETKLKYAIPYGLAVLSTESSVLLYYATSDMAIPSRYAYSIGYVFTAVTVVAITASEYARQDSEEYFYTEELKRQLEAMQASENAFLNAQMKPHFLYNTLNTIADCCVTDPEKAKSLINSLSEYLKLILSLDNMDETVPLRRELELAQSYTAIEKERFPSINFYTDFPLRLPSIMMPPLTIQPLIENAIKHGVRKSSKPGVVTLRIVEHPDSVEFFVSDNGVGMTQDQINNMFHEPKENQSIGIYNIDKRLKNIYHKGLVVESTVGLGTCVRFKVMKTI